MALFYQTMLKSKSKFYKPYRIQAAKRNFDLEIHNVTCTKSEDVIKRFDCNCKMISKGRFSSNLFLMLSRTLDKRAELHLLATFIPNKGVKSIKFMDIKLNICTILSQISRVPLIKNLMAEVRRKGNLPYECPVKGDFLYSLLNYTSDASLLPPYAPILKYNFTLTTFENNRKLGYLHISGALVPRT
ncbi:uncharacterized protein LOC106088909 [Stomoxys calcitrans]|uniref:uncharacterized protein LOC106088909 n=1 Tax=Stomoxys calcitrans TaxID=35570 RepID=UPI0027E2509C|nr:uncharacterized protein LOC106088909 [Stomoxys calcitrans]